MIMLFPFLIAVACLSPVLTLVSLWQVKEWRYDRLISHLRSEGVFRQLFGLLRPVVIGIWLLSSLVVEQIPNVILDSQNLTIGLLLLLCAITAMQILMKKQRYPVCTSKACIVMGLTMLIPIGITLSIVKQTDNTALIALIPLGCPLFVMISWIAIKPLDMVLKKRTMNRAKTLRKKYKNLVVIGITGSVGKTTTKELLAHILKKRGALATPMHVNTEMGVARWLISTLQKRSPDWDGTLIIEMGAYHRGEIRLLCDIAKPTLGIITYIGKQHLSLFGSEEAICKAKGELFEALPKEGHAFWNHDNEASAPLSALCHCAVTSVGTDRASDLHALDIEETGSGIRFTLEDVRFHIPIAGTHTMSAILLSIATARHRGMDLRSIAKELETFRPLERTFEVKNIEGITLLDDTYNASPDSMHAVIEWAKVQPHDEKVLVTDGIIELGEQEASIHAQLAMEAAQVFTKVYIANPRFLPYFKENGFVERAMTYNEITKVRSGALLVCVGRIPRSILAKILSNHSSIV